MRRSLRWRRARTRSGFTLIELLVVIVIIALIIGLAFPAIQGARATARRSSSRSNLRQIALAILNYEAQNGKLPVAERVAGKPRLGWITNILPQLERRDLFDRYDFSKDWFDPVNLPVTSTQISVLIDPSSPNADRLDSRPEAFAVTGTSNRVAITDYASIRQVDKRLFDGPGSGSGTPGQGGPNPGASGSGSPITAGNGVVTGGTYASGLTVGAYVNAAGDGIMPPNGTARMAEVRDGVSKTILLAESHGRPFLYRRGRLVNSDLLQERVNGGGWSRNANDIRLQGFNQDGTGEVGPYAINVANVVDAVPNAGQGPAAYGTDGTGAIYSFHAGGAHVAFGDASVRFLSEKIDIAVLASLVTRNQNELWDEKLVDVK